MAAVTICSDFGAQANEVCHCFHLLFHFIIRFIISSATVTQGAQRGKFPLPNSTQLRQYYFIKAEPQCYPEFRHLFNRSITSLLCAWRWPATWDTGRSRRASWPQTLGSERPRGGFLRFTLASRLPVGQPWPMSSRHPRSPGVLHPQCCWVSVLWSLPSLHFTPAAPPPTYSFPSGRPLSPLLPGWPAFSGCPLSWLYLFLLGLLWRGPDQMGLSWAEGSWCSVYLWSDPWYWALPHFSCCRSLMCSWHKVWQQVSSEKWARPLPHCHPAEARGKSSKFKELSWRQPVTIGESCLAGRHGV